MLGHLFELILGPGGHRMHLAIFVAHEVDIAGGHRNRLGTEPKEAADINDDLAGSATTVNMRHATDSVIVGAIDLRTVQNIWGQFGRRQADMVRVVHDYSPQ